jgi:hypothetical protein
MPGSGRNARRAWRPCARARECGVVRVREKRLVPVCARLRGPPPRPVPSLSLSVTLSLSLSLSVSLPPGRQQPRVAARRVARARAARGVVSHFRQAAAQVGRDKAAAAKRVGWGAPQLPRRWPPGTRPRRPTRSRPAGRRPLAGPGVAGAAACSGGAVSWVACHPWLFERAGRKGAGRVFKFFFFFFFSCVFFTQPHPLSLSSSTHAPTAAFIAE